jgi:hypothetical protein
MTNVPKYKEMTTASRQAAFMYLHGRCNDGGAWTWSEQLDTLFYICLNNDLRDEQADFV